MRTRSNKWPEIFGRRVVVAALAGAVALGATLIGASPASAVGALAVGDNGAYGFSYNYGSENDARARAQKECGGNCQVVTIFRNTCSAFAGDPGTTIYGWSWAPSEAQAKELAIGFCSKEGGKNCTVRVSACETNIKRDNQANARNVIGNNYTVFKSTQTAARVTPPPSLPPPPAPATPSLTDTSRATFNSPPVQPSSPSSFSSSAIDPSRASFGNTPNATPTPPPPSPVTPPRADPLPPRPAPQSVAAVEPPPTPSLPPQAPVSGLLNDGTKRVALVIGNDRYDSLPRLQKAVNDSRSIGETLSRLGFEVVRVENAQRRTMNQKLVEFTGKIGRGDTAFFFFAGHGVEIRGVNYLLPVDTPEARENEEGLITGEGIPADSILERLQERGAKVSLMVLDACRENPFKKQGSRGVGATRGLAQMTTPEGVFVLYSAGVGQTALDRLSDNDPNPNSVFTRAFISVLQKPDQSIQAMAKVTQQEVRRLAATVNHPQMPAYYDQILGQFTLAPAAR